MKRFLSLALCLMLCLSTLCCVNIYAADETETIAVTTSFDAAKGELVVSGSVVSKKGNIPMTLMVLDGAGNAYDAVDTVSESAVSGKTAYKFDAVLFSKTAPTDTYKVIVSCDFIYESTSVDFRFSGVDVKRDALEAMDNAYDNGKSIALAVAALDSYYDVFGFGSEYASYNDDQKEIVAKMLLKMEYNVPDDEDALTDAEIDSVFEQTIAANALSAEGKAIAEVIDCDDLAAWVKDYAVNYNFKVDNAETDYDEAVLAGYFDEAIKIGGFKKAIENCHVGVDNFAELAENLYEQAILYLSANSNYYKTRDILENDDIEEFIPIDRKDFNTLNNAKKTTLYQTICKKSYSSMDSFVDAIDDEVDDLKKSDTNSGTSSPVGGGSNKNTRPGVVVAEPGDIATTIFPFTDLVGMDWAVEPIQKLYYKGIVNGKTATEFDPNGLVTRAELAKMIVGALNLELVDYKNSFTDVDADDWHAKYVQTAYDKGIVKGDGSAFNPNGYITREDITVMIYRALELSPTDAEISIIDAYNISDYAYDAIVTLFDMGIMAGDGTGNVYPKDNATRAEAAKLIYMAFIA